MYSLYRAWLSLNSCTALPALSVPPVPLNLSLPGPGQTPVVPDVALQIGPSMTHFSAHRSVLSTHSGFFKAALANHTGLTPISVPNINVDEFSSLLTFMYTGYLDLNITNIYSILLATHILHMPRALELCRSFLMQQSQRTPTCEDHLASKINIVKPIASRKMTPSMQEYFSGSCYEGVSKGSDEVTLHRAEFSEAAATCNKTPLPVEKKSVCSKSSGSKKPNVANAGGSGSNKDKVIVDVACCDGPVRFHRVINKNYGVQDTENYDQQSFSASDFNGSTALNKAMSENIMEKLNSGDDQQQSNEVFTCVYCNHTFKSQYCYQKHARRHLYPVSVDKVAQAETKREVKLLDMNVQYYPCKTCGSKFPSYYFVHKHRKICHAEEVADKNNKNNEIVVETRAGNGEESSSCSAIDVEAVQNENEQEIT